MNFNKVKFGENVYDLVPSGITVGDNEARITFLPGNKTHEQVWDELSVRANVEKIYLRNSEDETIDVKVGYTKLTGLAKQTGYVISRDTTEGTDDTATVFIASLEKSAIEDKVAELEAEIVTLGGIIETILTTELEG